MSDVKTFNTHTGTSYIQGGFDAANLMVEESAETICKTIAKISRLVPEITADAQWDSKDVFRGALFMYGLQKLSEGDEDVLVAFVIDRLVNNPPRPIAPTYVKGTNRFRECLDTFKVFGFDAPKRVLANRVNLGEEVLAKSYPSRINIKWMSQVSQVLDDLPINLEDFEAHELSRLPMICSEDMLNNWISKVQNPTDFLSSIGVESALTSSTALISESEEFLTLANKVRKICKQLLELIPYGSKYFDVREIHEEEEDSFDIDVPEEGTKIIESGDLLDADEEEEDLEFEMEDEEDSGEGQSDSMTELLLNNKDMSSSILSLALSPIYAPAIDREYAIDTQFVTDVTALQIALNEQDIMIAEFAQFLVDTTERLSEEYREALDDFADGMIYDLSLALPSEVLENLMDMKSASPDERRNAIAKVSPFDAVPALSVVMKNMWDNTKSAIPEPKEEKPMEKVVNPEVRQAVVSVIARIGIVGLEVNTDYRIPLEAVCEAIDDYELPLSADFRSCLLEELETAITEAHGECVVSATMEVRGLYFKFVNLQIDPKSEDLRIIQLKDLVASIQEPVSAFEADESPEAQNTHENSYVADEFEGDEAEEVDADEMSEEDLEALTAPEQSAESIGEEPEAAGDENYALKP